MLGSVLDIKYLFDETRVSKLGTLFLNFGSLNFTSCRATQASHPGFHILQDNLSVVKVHVKRAPAAAGTRYPSPKFQ
ncbi:hypothetical protein P692DRAFT_20761060 [Suillus brevipes Sb2]|jgi:hypothetical protein|nr:hypothetical protein P692DRAFT_20761060 [Suillus brevipes Sb2]